MIERIRKWLSMKAYKHAKFYLFAFILLLNIIVVFIGGVLLHFLSPQDYENIWRGIWQVFTDILDPGFLNTFASMEGTGLTSMVEIVVIMVCMITFTGAIIGYISNMITTFLDSSVRGPKKLYLRNHIVILNWNSCAAGIISEYLYTEICEDVVVLTEDDRNRVSKEISDCLLANGFDKKQKQVNVVVKQGEPYSYSELIDVCLCKAKTIIVLNDSNPLDGDLKTLKTVMMVSQMNLKRKDCVIIVETNNQSIYELVKHVQNKEENNIIPAYLNKLLGKMLAHIALQPELNVVFAELFSHNGKEFYSIPISQFMDETGLSENEIIAQYYEMNHRSIPVTTSLSFNQDNAERIYILADKYSETLKFERIEEKISSAKLIANYPVQEKKIIVIGSNSKMKYMVNSFLAYMENYGRDSLNVYFIDTKEQLDKIAVSPGFLRINIEDRYNVLEIRRVIQKFDLSKINSIVLLSDDTVSPAEYDLGSLISLIDLNKEISTMEKSKRPEIIVEILNPQNYEIVQQYNIDNVIVSNKYISSLVAQIGDDDSIFKLIYDILTFDNEMDDFEERYNNCEISKELYVKECGLYFEEIPTFSSYNDLIRSVYYASEGRDVVLGIVYKEAKKNLNKKKNRTYFFPENLSLDKEVKLCAKDKLILFTAAW